jgi:uncharacterized protein (TIGR02117 family)
MKWIRIILKTVGYFLLGFIVFVLGYLALAYSLPHLHVNTGFVQPENGVDIYITSNGVHTDIIVPSKNKIMDWEQLILRKNFPGADTSYHWLSFGWGDKGFYLETPSWDQLKFSVAFKAVFYLGSTAMHVAYENTEPFNKVECHHIRISEEQYRKLIPYILASFRHDSNNQIELLPNHGYWENDRFYEAVGKYGFAGTCNSWTNRGLKTIGVKTGYWVPFQGGLMQQFQP